MSSDDMLTELAAITSDLAKITRLLLDLADRVTRLSERLGEGEYRGRHEQQVPS